MADVRKRIVSHNSRPSGVGRVQPGRRTVALPPGEISGRSSSPTPTTSPPAESSQDARSQPRPVKNCRFDSSIEPSAAPSGPSVTRTGAASWRCSHRAGLGRRSGQTRPSRQKLLSFGRSPKSPP